MGQYSAAVDAYIAEREPFARPILEYVRALVHEACPEVRESIKWSFAAFEYRGLLCSMAAFQRHASFGFWKHALLRERVPGLSEPAEKAMGSFGRLASIRDLPPRRTLLKLVREAMKLNEEGVARPVRTAVRKPAAVRPPAWFLARLRANRRALATWKAFAPSHRRDYLEWVTEAKTEATRERRLATTLEGLAAGKRRNWRYESKRARAAAPARARRRQKA